MVVLNGKFLRYPKIKSKADTEKFIREAAINF